ncbi:hypothetical protein Slin14017_G121040 [Septoria linicola]|nr:hypothetical protein Slin14017_G121040 [Septoria linicola]
MNTGRRNNDEDNATGQQAPQTSRSDFHSGRDEKLSLTNLNIDRPASGHARSRFDLSHVESSGRNRAQTSADLRADANMTTTYTIEIPKSKLRQEYEPSSSPLTKGYAVDSPPYENPISLSYPLHFEHCEREDYIRPSPFRAATVQVMKEWDSVRTQLSPPRGGSALPCIAVTARARAANPDHPEVSPVYWEIRLAQGDQHRGAEILAAFRPLIAKHLGGFEEFRRPVVLFFFETECEF